MKEGVKRQSLTHTVQCAVPNCFLWFTEFGHAYIDHVKRAHRATYKELDLSLMPDLFPAPKGQSMLPKSADHADADETPDLNPFLKPKNIGKVGATAKLKLTGKMHVSTGGDFGDQAMVEVVFKGKKYDLPVKLGKPSHRNLESCVGNNEKKWKGKTITVEVKHYMNNDFIAVQK